MAAHRRARRKLIVTALAAAIAIVVQGVASAAPGDVDTSFGDNGAKTVPIGGTAEVGGVVQRTDGTFVIGASTGPYVSTVALTRNGQLLSGYGSGGISSQSVPGASSVYITDVARRPDDRVVLAGYVYEASGTDGFVVARFRTGGAPDTSFSGDGVAVIRFPQEDAYGYGVALQPNGKIVVVGEVDPANFVSNPAIVRLNADGTLDRSFGTHGRVVVKVPDGVKAYDAPWHVVAEPNGTLAMAGWEQRKDDTYRTLAMRLLPTGALDRSFGGDGIVIVDADGVNNYAYSLARDGDKLDLGLHLQSSQAGVLRLTGSGARDTTFGGDGVAKHLLSVPWEVTAIAVLPDHRIVGANGYASGPNVASFKPGGKLDKSFGTNGEAVGPLTGAYAAGLVLTQVGKIVVTGKTSGSDVYAARFLGP